MMKIDDKLKRKLLIVQGCTLFFFVGFLSIFYMLGGGSQANYSVEEVALNLDTLPDVVVDEIPNDRLEAFKQATHLLKQEKELEEANNSFLFLEEDVEKETNILDTTIDESLFETLKEVVVGSSEAPIIPNRKQIAQRTPRKGSGGSATRTAKDETAEDWEAKMQAEIAERERRLQELYYGKKVVNELPQTSSSTEDEPTENEKEVKTTKNKNGFRTLGVSATSTAPKGSVRAVIHGEQKDITESSQIKLRILDPIEVDGFMIPRNTIIFGMASFSENRVNIDIENIAFRNNIYPFRGRIYDQDGFLGIYIPDNLVNDAKTEASSETVSSADVNFSGLTGIVSSGANAIVNAAKNVVTGSIRRTKVTLPANYKLIIKTNEK
ncbi:MAG: conjugative transposon protein TraM [Paludibacteraceae bacterium]|nr:conjugative transposon protein TraM [Paludibacteraceae bacterium]MBR6658939.1 conjugative transposon protein TraM [Paludibacteraceae bacterium]